jgi:hypothetical protein
MPPPLIALTTPAVDEHRSLQAEKVSPQPTPALGSFTVSVGLFKGEDGDGRLGSADSGAMMYIGQQTRYAATYCLPRLRGS